MNCQLSTSHQSAIQQLKFISAETSVVWSKHWSTRTTFCLPQNVTSIYSKSKGTEKVLLLRYGKLPWSIRLMENYRKCWSPFYVFPILFFKLTPTSRREYIKYFVFLMYKILHFCVYVCLYLTSTHVYRKMLTKFHCKGSAYCNPTERNQRDTIMFNNTTCSAGAQLLFAHSDTFWNGLQ